MFLGSRKHVLDWTEQPEFKVALRELVDPEVSVRFPPPESFWMPRGHREPLEARLERKTGHREFLSESLRKDLLEWWLVHTRGANTPNWDIAVRCEVEGTWGLVLVEAKAHRAELSSAGKQLTSTSTSSSDNHKRIALAISSARVGLQRLARQRVEISRDKHYQLSNRLAFAWKLATLGVPTVLVYLGFLGDSYFEDLLSSGQDWRNRFFDHAGQVAPRELFDRRLDLNTQGSAPAWFLVKSKRVRETSRSDSQSANR